MKVGIFLVLFGRRRLEEALAYVRAVGWQAKPSKSEPVGMEGMPLQAEGGT